VSASSPPSITIETTSGTHCVLLSGSLLADDVARAWDALAAKTGDWRVDASELEHCDGAGLAFLWLLQREKKAKIQGLNPAMAALLEPFDSFDPVRQAPPPPRESACEVLGKLTVRFLSDIRDQIAFVGEFSTMLVTCVRHPRFFRWSDMWLTAQTAGVNALLVAGLVSFLTGMIMAFQSSGPLRQFGVDIYVVNLVALAMLRELGPIMTAVVLAGRSGSAFAAEIGTMKVNEEINALRTMGLDPMRFLVVPRVVAGFLVTPALTVYANFLGVGGGLLVMVLLGFPMATLWKQLMGAVAVTDVLTGIIKSFVFGGLVAGVGCLRGLQTGTGATAVGESTTKSVVTSIFLVTVVDAIFAVLFYAIKW